MLKISYNVLPFFALLFVQCVADKADSLSATDKPTELTALSSEFHPASKSSTGVRQADKLEIHLNVEKTDKGGYAHGGPWVTIGYQNASDYSNYITASRIALAANLLISTWESWEYPNVDKVKERLSNFYVAAIENSEEMARLRYSELYLDDRQAAIEQTGDLGAFVSTSDRFVDIPEKARFLIVIKADFLNDGWIDTVLHELGHMALEAGFGNSDSNHERIDFWLPRTGFDNGSFLSDVLSQYP